MSCFACPQVVNEAGSLNSFAVRVVPCQVDSWPVEEPEPTYYIVGAYNGWGATGYTKMRRPSTFCAHASCL